jgi:lipopolysaccharide export system ATP-binding protein
MRGTIELDGNDVTPLPMYQRARLGIGYLPQEASIFRGLTVEQNIRAVLEVVEPDAKRRARPRRAAGGVQHHALAQVAIDRALRRRAAARGDRSRAGQPPELHAARRAVCRHRPDRGRRHPATGPHLTYRGIGVLITDHNVRETLGLTDRAYIIYSGEVLMEGRAEDIVNNADVRRLYLGEEFRL